MPGGETIQFFRTVCRRLGFFLQLRFIHERVLGTSCKPQPSFILNASLRFMTDPFSLR
jgi:hypothetical protein